MARKLFRIGSWRRLAVLLAILAVLPAAWLLWHPGSDVRDGRHDRGTNGIWMQHGWLADDDWLKRNKKDVAAFRDEARLEAAAELLKSHHMRYVYPHLCPCTFEGGLPGTDAGQVERFLDAFRGMEVLPWVGGVRDETARVSDAEWRARFAAACAGLIRDHPRLAGVHVNIEPMPSGDRAYLALLEELRRALPEGKRISIAAYPPPTRWQPTMEVHWDEAFSRAVASRVDQVVVMMYDTGLHKTKFYEQLMKDWTREVLNWYAPREVLLGVPAYEDAGVDYHDADVENVPHALAGIHAGLGSAPAHYGGVAIYSEWVMTPEKWQDFKERFERPAP